jgi:hypothetical protein
MTAPYAPPKSRIEAAPSTPRSLSRLMLGFLSGFLALPLLRLLIVLVIYLRVDADGVTFGPEDLPSATDWLVFLANGAACGFLAWRFTSYPTWLVAASGIALPLLLVVAAAISAAARLAA